jgi:polyisoprenoid-binding protein YceI
MKNLIKSTLLAAVIATSATATAATYVIDDAKAGAHSQIDVKVNHIGVSWVKGRFNNFEGTFEYDKSKPNDSSVQVTIDTQSFDSNHAKRDKHVMSDDFLNAAKFPTATFKSTSIKSTGEGVYKVSGDFNLHGVTKAVAFDANLIGEGDSPWGDYRAGFEGSVNLVFSDFGIDTAKIGVTEFTVNMFFEGKTAK